MNRALRFLLQRKMIALQKYNFLAQHIKKGTKNSANNIRRLNALAYIIFYTETINTVPHPNP